MRKCVIKANLITEKTVEEERKNSGSQIIFQVIYVGEKQYEVSAKVIEFLCC